jgi:hypothetical protein
MYHYVAYGLGIRSALPLPELMSQIAPHGALSGEIAVRLGPVRRSPPQVDAAGFGFWATADEACHFVEKVGAFLVRGGREIVVDPVPGVEERLLRLSLLGPAMALLLHQRGLLVLHASVVARRGEAVAFLGNNGWGKSTIAGALYAKGYDVVADDVAAIGIDPGGPIVFPGFPQLKLWPEAATLLGETPERLPVLHPGFDKRGWHVGRGFSTEGRRLERVYVLAQGPAPALEPLEPRQAWLELMRNWYGNRFGRGLLQTGGSAALHLRQCVALASRVPMHRLRRSGGPSTLLHLADLVHEDLLREASVPSRAQELRPGLAGTESNPR